MTTNAFGGDNKLPLYMVDAHGNNTAIAQIRPLAHGGFYVEALTGMPPVLLGENKDGLYDDLPYFLQDLRPQGFLGRQIAEEMSLHSGDFPSDPRYWNTQHVGRYLIANGEDLPGNLKFGEQAHLRIRRKPVITTADNYPELADSVMKGMVPGSSAGGEQQKFTAFCDKRSSHVIVKFSPKGNSAIAQRWRDILITEYHATEAIHQMNFPAAETVLIETGGRLFLESQRFDRSGLYGRLSMASLESIDAEFIGLGSNWVPVMKRLHQKKLVSQQHYYDAVFLHGFGRLINNTDMHLGNLSFGIDGDVFRILPVYDMCSMGFAPKGGEVYPYDFIPRKMEQRNLNVSDIGALMEMAHDFWGRVRKDGRISDQLSDFLAKGNPIDRMMLGERNLPKGHEYL